MRLEWASAPQPALAAAGKSRSEKGEVSHSPPKVVVSGRARKRMVAPWLPVLRQSRALTPLGWFWEWGYDMAWFLSMKADSHLWVSRPGVQIWLMPM